MYVHMVLEVSFFKNNNYNNLELAAPQDTIDLLPPFTPPPILPLAAVYQLL